MLKNILPNNHAKKCLHYAFLLALTTSMCTAASTTELTPSKSEQQQSASTTETAQPSTQESTEQFSIPQIVDLVTQNIPTILGALKAKALSLCSTIDQLTLYKFSKNNEQTFKKLTYVLTNTIETSLKLHPHSTKTIAITTDQATIIIEENEYRQAHSFIKHKITQPASPANDQKEQKNAHIQQLVNDKLIQALCSIITIFVTGSIRQNDTTLLVKNDVKKILCESIAQSLTLQELSELTKFISSPLYKKLCANINEFVAIFASIIPSSLHSIITSSYKE